MRKENSSLGYYIATSNDPTPTVQYGMSLESTVSADSIEELAKLIEVDPATLQATVDRYNELCEKGVDEDFGKPADKMYPIKGLYAAGETAFEGLFGTEYPGCGVAISAGSYYGRVAGENAANEAKAN